MTLDLLTGALQAVLDAFAAMLNAVFAAWPIGMPDLPSLPDGVVTAVGWVKWSPIPVDAGLAFLLFAISVWVAWLVARPIMRWLRWGGD